jgi:hypothetical protein
MALDVIAVVSHNGVVIKHATAGAAMSYPIAPCSRRHEMSDQPIFYHGSQGAQLVADMHLAHLGNAVRKIERVGPAHEDFENLDAIKAVFERRQAEWEAANPDKVQR